MMPLNLANIGEKEKIIYIGGSQKLKKHLQDLGFIVGDEVMVVASTEGNMIIKVKESRVAINGEMAGRIYV